METIEFFENSWNRPQIQLNMFYKWNNQMIDLIHMYTICHVNIKICPQELPVGSMQIHATMLTGFPEVPI